MWLFFINLTWFLAELDCRHKQGCKKCLLNWLSHFFAQTIAFAKALKWLFSQHFMAFPNCNSILNRYSIKPSSFAGLASTVLPIFCFQNFLLHYYWLQMRLLAENCVSIKVARFQFRLIYLSKNCAPFQMVIYFIFIFINCKCEA